MQSEESNALQDTLPPWSVVGLWAATHLSFAPGARCTMGGPFGAAESFRQFLLANRHPLALEKKFFATLVQIFKVCKLPPGAPPGDQPGLTEAYFLPGIGVERGFANVALKKDGPHPADMSTADPAMKKMISAALQWEPIVAEREDPTVDGAPTTVTVDLGDRSYPIYIGAGLLDRGELLRRHVKGKKVLIVTNTTVAPLYLDRTIAALTDNGRNGTQVESVLLPDGEQYKDLATLVNVFDKALETRMDRRCTFVALGGGVVGDMCGFAAATYLRGVNFIQIPTTLMAQVDSSVGGKTGVNHPLGKNMIGAFFQPQCVLIDTDTLETLPDREFASGIAEVIKYGLIRDSAFFEWQEQNMEALLAREPAALVYAIKRSCENKADVVAADEKEGGVRATLNLGHTFGHAIENGLGYGEWLHGEAVAAGTVMAADMSLRLGWIDAHLQQRVIDIFQRARLPIAPPKTVGVATFKSLMAVDKKVADGQLRLILLKGQLGSCVFTADFAPTALENTLEAFCT